MTLSLPQELCQRRVGSDVGCYRQSTIPGSVWFEALSFILLNPDHSARAVDDLGD